MIDEDIRAALADELRAASATQTPIRPLTSAHPTLSVADAYDIQHRNIERDIAAGARVVGHKIGLTSAVMQEMMGVDVPDFGHLTDAMLLDVTVPVPLGPFIQPRVEVEIAYILGADLVGPGITRADVEAAVSDVIPCLELIDSRIQDWRIGLADTIADNASSAAVLLGTSRSPGDVLRGEPLPATLRINGETVAEGSTADVLGHPAEAVAWLANALGEFGVRLRAGDVVLSGSCTRAVDVRPGDRVEAVFEGLAPVEVTFA